LRFGASAGFRDFRGDLPRIDVPTLVVHGAADGILPFEATAARLRDERTRRGLSRGTRGLGS
jgi:pimeloyl-ACP methyl ester carboxylesterase